MSIPVVPRPWLPRPLPFSVPGIPGASPPITVSLAPLQLPEIFADRRLRLRGQLHDAFPGLLHQATASSELRELHLAKGGHVTAGIPAQDQQPRKPSSARFRKNTGGRCLVGDALRSQGNSEKKANQGVDKAGEGLQDQRSWSPCLWQSSHVKSTASKPQIWSI